MTIRNTILTASVLAVSALAALPAAAQFPEQQVTIVVPYSAGGGTDILARLVGQKLSEAIGQPVVIENHPGAGTITGTTLASRADPDGYTLLLTTNTLPVNESLYLERPYELSDLQPVTMLARSPNLLIANAEFPPQNLAELIEYARENPGEVSYASSGVGGTGHLAMELLKTMADIDMVHVPYQGGGPALAAVMGNETPLLFNQIVSVMPHVNEGTLRPMGVTSAERSSAAPDVPTIAEAGLPGFEMTAWFGFFLPAGTSDDIVDFYYTEISGVLQDEEVRQNLESSGADVVGNTPDEFAAVIDRELETYATLIEAAGIEKR